jgi:hypothetical protein
MVSIVLKYRMIAWSICVEFHKNCAFNLWQMWTNNCKYLETFMPVLIWLYFCSEKSAAWMRGMLFHCENFFNFLGGLEELGGALKLPPKKKQYSSKLKCLYCINSWHCKQYWFWIPSYGCRREPWSVTTVLPSPKLQMHASKFKTYCSWMNERILDSTNHVKADNQTSRIAAQK